RGDLGQPLPFVLLERVDGEADDLDTSRSRREAEALEVRAVAGHLLLGARAHGRVAQPVEELALRVHPRRDARRETVLAGDVGILVGRDVLSRGSGGRSE